MKWLKNLFGPAKVDAESLLASHDVLARIVEGEEGFTVVVTSRWSPVFDTADELQAHLDAKGGNPPEDVTVHETAAGAYAAQDYELGRVKPQPTRERLLAYLTGLNYMNLARKLQDADYAVGGWKLTADGRSLPMPPRPPLNGGWS